MTSENRRANASGLPSSARPLIWRSWVAVAACLLGGLAMQGLLVADERVYTRDLRKQHVYRSTRTEGQWFDELDMPRFPQRRNHRAFEARTKHFVLVSLSPLGREQADWAARQTEGIWAEACLLADQWTDVHHNAKFGMGMVEVFVIGAPWHPHMQPAPGPTKLNFQPIIYMPHANMPGQLEKRNAQLRREIFLSFLRVSTADKVLPDWVQLGMAQYFSGEPAPQHPIDRLTVPAVVQRYGTGVWARRRVQDEMFPLDEDTRQAILWVDYLLKGNDAEYAPELFAAMSREFIARKQDPYNPGEGIKGVERFEPPVRSPQPRYPLHTLLRSREIQAPLGDWLEDRDTGQPIIRPASEEIEVDESLREMALILKLMRRFGMSLSSSIRPRVNEFGVGSYQPTSAAVPSSVGLTEFYERLVSPRQASWATLDTDGSLLLSSNHARLAELLRNPSRRYRTFRREKHLVLEVKFETGEVFESWLEKNEENPKRPIARIAKTSDGKSNVAVSSFKPGNKSGGKSP